MLAELLAVQALLSGPDAVEALQPAIVCSDVYVIAARGSGEAAGGEDLSMGAPLHATFLRLAAQLEEGGQSVGGMGIDYPAVPIDGSLAAYVNAAGLVLHLPGAFASSVDTGAAEMVREVAAVTTRCPGTRIVLGGFSQGASVVVEAVQKLTPVQKAAIGAVLVFGDPGFNPADTAAGVGGFDPDHGGLSGPHELWSDMIAAPVISFCHAGDHVCGISKRFDLGEGATQLWYRDAGFILGYDAEHDVSLYEPHSSYELESGRAAHRVALALAYAPVVSAADEPVAPDRAPPPPMPHPDGGLLLALGAALLRVRRAAPLEQPELSDAEPLCRAPAVRRSWSIGHGLHARPPAVPVRALTVRALTARAQGSARVTHSA